MSQTSHPGNVPGFDKTGPRIDSGRPTNAELGAELENDSRGLSVAKRGRPPQNRHTAYFADIFSRWLRSRISRYHGPLNGVGLAARIGVDQSLVGHWKKGKYPEYHRTSPGQPLVPSRQHCLAIAAALNEPPDLVLLLAGHAPNANPEHVFRLLHPLPDVAEVARQRKAVAL